jgi:hypothetical protein
MAVQTLLSYSDGWHARDGNVYDYPGTPPPPPPPPGGLLGDPGINNIYVGVTNDHLASRESFCGHRMGVVRTYWNYTTASSAVSKAAADIAAGRVPWISFKLTATGGSANQTWAQFAASPGSWFADTLSALAAIGGGPIMFTLHHEPNDNNSTAQDAIDHKAMYRTAKTFTDAYPTILLTTCLMANYYDISTSGQSSGPLKVSDWVSDDGFDVGGYDSYNHISYNPANGKKNLTISQAYGLQTTAYRAISSTKPLAVGEMGVRTNPTVPGQAATWMRSAYNFLRQSHYMAMSWYDTGIAVNDGGSPWTLDDTTDGTDGTERVTELKNEIALSTSAFVPLGGVLP